MLPQVYKHTLEVVHDLVEENIKIVQIERVVYANLNTNIVRMWVVKCMYY